MKIVVADKVYSVTFAAQDNAWAPVVATATRPSARGSREWIINGDAVTRRAGGKTEAAALANLRSVIETNDRAMAIAAGCR